MEPKLLRYSYFTAGSGGAGPTILETSFLLAGEPCTVYKDGQAFTLPPISNPRTVDFGPGGGLAPCLGPWARCWCRHACLAGGIMRVCSGAWSVPVGHASIGHS